MNTPSITYIHAKGCGGDCGGRCDGASVYRHDDGDPSKHGVELAQLLVESEANGFEGLREKVIALSIKGGSANTNCSPNTCFYYCYSVAFVGGKFKLAIQSVQDDSDGFRLRYLFNSTPETLLAYGCKG